MAEAYIAISNLHRRRFEERARQCPTPKRNLEGVVLAGFRAGEGGFGGAVGRVRGDRLADEQLLRLARAPRHSRHPAERNAGLPHRAAGRHVEGDGSGGERELIRLAIADLEVARPAGPVASGNDKADDHLVRRKGRLDVRSLRRTAMEASEGDRAPLVAAARLDDRIERDQRLGEIAGIGRDALLADPEDGVSPIEAVERRTA
jgi:hypothetical protein